MAKVEERQHLSLAGGGGINYITASSLLWGMTTSA